MHFIIPVNLSVKLQIMKYLMREHKFPDKWKQHRNVVKSLNLSKFCETMEHCVGVTFVCVDLERLI